MAMASEIRSVETGLFARVTAIVNGLREQRRRYRMYRETRNELRDLTDRELADIGLHRSQIDAIAVEAAYGA